MIEPVAIPELPKIAVKRPHCVATVATGERGKQLLDISRPSIQRYAAKCNADYQELVTDTALIPVFPLWNKYQVEKLFDHYERIVYVDADVIVRDTAPDLFDLVPETHVGKHDDLPHMHESFAWYWVEIEELCRTQGYPMPVTPPWMLNSGLWVASGQHRDCFKPPLKPFNARHCAEQHHISMRLWQSNTPVYLMSSDLHWQWYRDKTLQTYAKGQFVHFAGLTDHQKRINLMKITAGGIPKKTLAKAPTLTTVELQPEKDCGCKKGKRTVR